MSTKEFRKYILDGWQCKVCYNIAESQWHGYATPEPPPQLWSWEAFWSKNIQMPYFSSKGGTSDEAKEKLDSLLKKDGSAVMEEFQGMIREIGGSDDGQRA